MSTSLEDVTASFAASLALASGDVIDISHLDRPDEPRPNPKLYLLARATNSTHVNSDDLQSHFKRIWLIKRRFRVQARDWNLFIITFDLPKDRNKVFWEGPWYYRKMPLVVEEYDGLKSPTSILMDKLYLWVWILNMPKALENDWYIRNTASVAGFQFKGARATETQPSVVRGLFDPQPSRRKPIIICLDSILEETDPETLALVALDKGKTVQPTVESLKRGRPLSPCASLKKLKLPNGSAGESPLSSLKKQKTPIPRIIARALSLLDEGKSSDSGNGIGAAGKKKRGRPFGSKNVKNLQVEEKKEEEGGVTMQASNVQPSPNPKGKDVL